VKRNTIIQLGFMFAMLGFMGVYAYMHWKPLTKTEPKSTIVDFAPDNPTGEEDKINPDVADTPTSDASSIAEAPKPTKSKKHVKKKQPKAQPCHSLDCMFKGL
jgi:hypothetical protein